MRRALKWLLLSEGFDVVGEAPDGREAVRQCALRKPEIAVVDVSMPLLNGIEAARAIAEASPGTRVVLLTTYAASSVVRAGRRAGVSGCVSKANASRELGPAIRAVHGGGTYFSGPATPDADLTERPRRS